MDDDAERLRILEMIDSGKITAEEGLLLLRALAESRAESEEDEFPLDDSELADSFSADPIRSGFDAEPWSSQPLAMPGPKTAAIPLTAPAFSPVPAEVPPASIPMPGGEPLPLGSAAEPQATASPADFGSRRSTASHTSADLPPAPSELPPSAARWKRWWTIPLWIGVAITVMGGLFMYSAVQSSGGVSFMFLCASVPFAIGILLMVVAFQSRTAPWLHLRVQQKPGESPQRIAISLPLPVGVAAWGFRTFGHKIPNTDGQDIGQMIEAVGRNATPENPLYIQVDEGDDGEKVEIYIG